MEIHFKLVLPPNGQRNPPRGCGESPFASRLPESA